MNKVQWRNFPPLIHCWVAILDCDICSGIADVSAEIAFKAKE